MHHHNKFREAWSNCCSYVAILWFTWRRPPPSWIFKKSRNFNGRSVKGQYASSCQILSKSVKRLHLTDFSKWRLSAILDLLGAYWNPRWLLVGLYRWAKFGWNRCINFDNMKLSLFYPFGLKTPIHAPQLFFRGGGDFTPKWWVISTEPPKNTPYRESASFEPPRVQIRRRVGPVGEFPKKGINK